MQKTEYTKKTISSSKQSFKFSKKPSCFNYFFNLCRTPNYESFDHIENGKSVIEEPKILVTQHYSSHVITSKTHKKTQNNYSPTKFLFKLSPDLKLYSNMQLLLTFNTNMFILKFGRRGIIAKISVKLMKIDRSNSEKFSFEKSPFNLISRIHSKSSNHNTSVKNSLNDIETSLHGMKRSQIILQEIIHNVSKKILINSPLIIDISHSEGIGAVAWADKGVNVIVIEENPISMIKLKSNILLSGEKRKIDIIFAKFEDMARMRANLIFLQPVNSYICEFSGELLYNENFSLKQNLITNNGINIAQCLQVAENLVILLPKCCDLNELAEVFSECFDENNMFFNIIFEFLYFFF